ncbi:MAG: DUF4893 domain-containing protein [Pseudomonadota bacterium]
MSWPAISASALRAVLALSLGAVGGCSGKPAPLPTGVVAAARVPEADWRRVVTGGDRQRLRNWRQSWLAATAAARGADDGAQARDPALFAPDRALPDAVPPAGNYTCRVVKLGARDPAMRPFTSYPPYTCRVMGDGDVIGFEKLGGSQRHVGRIFRDGAGRGIFLGTMMLGDEAHALSYGRDLRRDLAGFVERIGPRRWRIALPEPRFESRLDLIELVPAA